MSERWIVIHNWDEFQHYKDRSPRWIKNYTELLHDEGYRTLTGHQRGLLHGLWLEYASARAHLTLNTRSLTRRLGLRVMMRDLDALSHAGFIAFSASKPLAQLYPREEKIRKEPPSIPPTGSEWESVRKAEDEQLNGKTGYVHNLNSYTGVRVVRGETGLSHIYDPLGTEPKPQGWPHKTPSRAEIVAALKVQAVA